MTGRALEWEAPLPDDMARLLSRAAIMTSGCAEPER